MKRTIVFDFDGVLHSYTSGWHGPDAIVDPPVPGMAQLLWRLRELEFEIVVVSTRAGFPGCDQAIASWLESNGFPGCRVTSEKVPADLYVDDRAFRFEGDAQAVLGFVLADVKPWNRGEQISRGGKTE